MQPATAKRWHKTAFRAYWRWKSNAGRKPLREDMRSLIRQLSRENPPWSPERIRRTLKLMKIKPPCIDTIAKYMGRPRKPRKSGTGRSVSEGVSSKFPATHFNAARHKDPRSDGVVEPGSNGSCQRFDENAAELASALSY